MANRLLQCSMKHIKHRICKVDAICYPEAGSRGPQSGEGRELWCRFRAILWRGPAMLARLITKAMNVGHTTYLRWCCGDAYMLKAVDERLMSIARSRKSVETEKRKTSDNNPMPLIVSQEEQDQKVTPPETPSCSKDSDKRRKRNPE